ncbi:MAG TPA: hypothetical protein VGQ42_09870 [Candidatus Dormibacteraeota bacterium]|jgi:DNA polymerase-3 subunit gamma/tau|nr:hypothetical protein [Candidatus Dormibacteraeota bacterium]
MNRTFLAATGVLGTLALAACGSGATASTGTSSGSASPSPSGSANARRGGGTAGELVKVNGTTLVLNTTGGDVSVDVSGSSLVVSKTRTGTVADVVAGMCLTASGQKDSAGVLTASTVQLRAKVNGTCNAPAGGPGGPGAPGGTPDPSGTPRPSRTPQPGVVPPAFARGEVTKVAGTAVTLQDATGTAVSITVPTTVQVGVTDTIAKTDLSVGDCVLATGQKDSKGVVAARSVSVVPAGPSGCFTGTGPGAGGGFGRGFGGGGFGGGGGGGGAAGGPPAGA